MNSSSPAIPKNRQPSRTRVGNAVSLRPWWIAVAIAVVLSAFTLWAWPPRPAPEPHVERGNELYRHRRYREALTEYESAPGAGPRFAGVQLNRGLARYRTAVPPDDGGGLPLLAPDAGAPEGLAQAQEEMRTAARGGTTSIPEEVDPFLRARAVYDLGNTFFSTRQWDNAIDAYKEALRLRPSWRDAAWNLELARRLREMDRHPPDAGPDAAPPDASQDASPPDGSSDGGRDSGAPDAGGRGDASGPDNRDAGTGRDASAPSPDGGARNQPPDAGAPGQDAGGPPPDAAPPRSMAPLDALERTTRSLQNEIMRRRGIVPRGPDDDR